MLQLLPQTTSIELKSGNSENAIEIINKYIDCHNCENLSIDISSMNIVDACYVSTLCSTKHYIKYPNGKINWKIPSELIKEFNSSFELENIEYEY